MGKVKRTKHRYGHLSSYVHQVLTIGTPIEGQVPVLGFGGREFARVWGIYRRVGLGGDGPGLII